MYKSMSASTISGEARRYNILNGRKIFFLTMAMGIFASSQVLGGNNELYDGDAVGRRRRYTAVRRVAYNNVCHTGICLLLSFR